MNNLLFAQPRLHWCPARGSFRVARIFIGPACSAAAFARQEKSERWIDSLAEKNSE
jgi:hypothetical protein